jgi:cytochrome P450
LQLSIALLVACAAEFAGGYGTSALIISLFVWGVFQARAVPHDNIPPAEGYLPIIGHLHIAVQHFNKHLYQVYLDDFKRAGPERTIYSSSLPFGRNFVFVSDPKMIDQLFRIQFGDAWKGDELRDMFEPLLGHGIFMSDGDAWRRHRSVAAQMFTARSLKDYMFDVFTNTAEKMMDKLAELRGADGDGVIDIYDIFNRLTIEAFTEVAFGVSIDSISVAPKNEKMSVAFEQGFALCSQRMFDSSWPIKRWLGIGGEADLQKHSQFLRKFIQGVIVERRKEFEAKSGIAKQYDLLSMFLDRYPDISDDELRDVTMNFVLAARDTTAQLMSWFNYQLCDEKNAGVRAKVYQEIDDVLDDQPLDYSRVSKLPYLENSFQESLRLWPSVPFLVRYAKTDIPLDDGHIIRKGDAITIHTWSLARLSWLWGDDCEEFKPERHEGTQFTPAELPSFNIPPRLCLGKHVALLETKIAIVKLFQKYEVVPVDLNDVVYDVSITMQMKNGFKVRLKERER